MRVDRLSWMRTVLVGVGTLFWTAPSFAAFEIVSESVAPDVASKQTTFTITFNQSPDFFGVSADGNPRNAFQYFYGSVLLWFLIGILSISKPLAMLVMLASSALVTFFLMRYLFHVSSLRAGPQRRAEKPT